MQILKHLERKLDKKLSFKDHLKDKFAKVNNRIGISKKLGGLLTHLSLVTLYSTKELESKQQNGHLSVQHSSSYYQCH